MTLLRSTFVALILISAVVGQSSMTLPAGYLTTASGSGTSFPFNNANDHSWQWHYDSSNFSIAGVSGVITITDISIRAINGTTAIGAFDFPSVDVSIGSGTTGYGVGNHDPTFANNLCTDFTQVRSGPWQGGPVPASLGAVANWFSMGPIAPYAFDASAGKDLIVEIRKCGTIATLAASIDGVSGATGTVLGNRYGDTASCSATTSSFQNNEFVPLIKIDYIAGGTPGTCVTEYQTNQPAASMTVNGAPDPGGGSPLISLLSVGQVASVDLSSTQVGNVWDIGFSFSALAVPVSAGGFATPGGQSVNMDFLNPGFTWLNGGLVGGTFANTSIPLVPASPLSASGQMAVANPGVLDGLSISHANEVSFVGCGGSDFEGLAAGNTSAPAGWTNGGVGAPWTVDASGTPSTGTGPTAATSGSNYIYCETSGAFGVVFTLDTCPIDLTTLASPTGTVTFNLSRIGATIGTLEILVDDGSGAGYVPVTDLATGMPVTYVGADPGQAQGATEWSAESVPFLHNISSSVASIRFRYTSGTSFTGDIALDDVDFN